MSGRDEVCSSGKYSEQLFHKMVLTAATSRSVQELELQTPALWNCRVKSPAKQWLYNGFGLSSAKRPVCKYII